MCNLKYVETFLMCKKFLFFVCFKVNNLFNNSCRSQLPARATRLLNRRLQNNSNNNNNPSPINGCDSPRSLDSMHSRNSSARASLREHLKQRQQLNLQSQLMNLHSSSEDLLADKSLKNSMLNDVVCFKKQLVQLRRILQEVSIVINYYN